MAYKKIGQDVSVQIGIGGYVDGAGDNTSTTSVKSLAKSISIDQEAITEDVSSLGDSIKVSRVKRVGAKLKLEMFVPSTGAQFTFSVGHYATALVDGIIYKGLVLNYSLSVPDGAQTETLEIEIGADGNSSHIYED